MSVDKFRLIEEVRKKPLLWDHKNITIPRNVKKCEALWNKIGQILDVDATTCKRIWGTMRMQFCNEANRIPRRIAKAKRTGSYAPNKRYYSWVYFDHLRFVANGLSSKARFDLSFENDSDNEIVENDNTNQIEYELSDSNSFQSGSDNGIEIKTENNNESDDDIEIIVNDNLDEDDVLQKESDNSSPVVPVHDTDKSKPKDTNFMLYTVSLSGRVEDNECATISNDKTVQQSDATVKEVLKEVKIKKEPDSSAELNVCFENSNVIAYNDMEEFISSPLCTNDNVNKHSDPSMFPEEHISRSPDSNDEDYSFLYSFLSQMKVMTQLQRMEFRANMKKLLVHTFPAAASVNILEKQLLLPEDSDPDRKFLISFWPFITSMPRSKNLQFRLKMTELVYKILFREANQ